MYLQYIQIQQYKSMAKMTILFLHLIITSEKTAHLHSPHFELFVESDIWGFLGYLNFTWKYRFPTDLHIFDGMLYIQKFIVVKIY